MQYKFFCFLSIDLFLYFELFFKYAGVRKCNRSWSWSYLFNVLGEGEKKKWYLFKFFSLLIISLHQIPTISLNLFNKRKKHFLPNTMCLDSVNTCPDTRWKWMSFWNPFFWCPLLILLANSGNDRPKYERIWQKQLKNQCKLYRKSKDFRICVHF